MSTACDDQYAPDTSRVDAATARYDAAFEAVALRPVYDASNSGTTMALELASATRELDAALAEFYLAREAALSGS